MFDHEHRYFLRSVTDLNRVKRYCSIAYIRNIILFQLLICGIDNDRGPRYLRPVIRHRCIDICDRVCI